MELVRAPRPMASRSRPTTSINSLHLTDVDIGFFDSRARLSPPLRQQRDRDALSAALADGTIDVLVSDHNPVDEDAKTCPLPRPSPAPPGWSCCCRWRSGGRKTKACRCSAPLAAITAEPARVLGTAWVRCKPAWASWSKAAWLTCACSTPGRLDGAGRRPAQPGHTPFSGYELPGCVRATLVGGHVAFERA